MDLWFDIVCLIICGLVVLGGYLLYRYIYREGIKMGLVKRNYEDEEWGDLSGEEDHES